MSGEFLQGVLGAPRLVIYNWAASLQWGDLSIRVFDSGCKNMAESLNGPEKRKRVACFLMSTACVKGFVHIDIYRLR